MIEFPEISRNCSMTRQKGSANKMIHFKTRNSLDIQKICDTDSMLNGTHPPLYWLLRLIEISGNLPYIICTKNLGITAKQFIITEYITPEIELKAEASKDLIFEKPGPRNNDCLKYDIEIFIQNAFNYYLKFWNEENPHDYIRIRKEVSDLRVMAKRGLKKCLEGHYQKLFLIDDGKSGNFQPIQSDISFHSTADLKTVDDWHLSWMEFWEMMTIAIDRLAEQFTEPKFYYKGKKGDKIQKFNKWLLEGLDEFLEPTNPNMTNDDTKIKYLKYLILSKSDMKL